MTKIETDMISKIAGAIDSKQQRHQALLTAAATDSVILGNT
jgi:hypothetical protein